MVLASLRLNQEKLGAPPNDVGSMADKFVQQLLERKRARPAINECEQDDGKRVLDRRELIELIQPDVTIGIAFQFDNDANRVASVAFVDYAANARDAIFLSQLGYLLYERVTSLLEWDFGDNDTASAS